MKAIKKYLKELEKIESTGIDTEISYYHPLHTLIREMGGKDVQVIDDAKKQMAGKPDFTILAANGDTIGYVEAKAPGTDLKSKEKTSQLKKYIATFPNFIFTNFHEFRLYYKGTLVSQTSLQDGGLVAEVTKNREADFSKLLNRFLSKTIPVATEVKIIAELLAEVTKETLKPAIASQLERELAAGVGELYGAYKDFRSNLLHDMTEEQFVDMYAQTITYGLLTAKMQYSDGVFDRKNALFDIPKGFGVLHAIFKFIATDDLSDEMEAAIDEIVGILVQTNPERILLYHYVDDEGEDWFIHFYETFLSKYNQAERKHRGVYYTPDAVVSYITRSVNRILKEKFGKDMGFGDVGVRVLDPSAGTLSFITSACRLGIDKMVASTGDGVIDGFIKNHILKHFYGFELMMTPYVLGHLKMFALLSENAYQLSTERINLFLTNTLDTSHGTQSHITPIGVALEKEAECVRDVRAKTPILAIIGNPPYQSRSENVTDFTKKEMDVYKRNLNDIRALNALSDDYIKFIRFAQWKVDQQGCGVIGFITNNSYIDGLTHKSMRKSLLDSFDEIYVLNLHGNMRTEKKTPTGGKDENIFGIKPGVAITFFIKHKKPCDSVKVHYKDVWGTTREKIDYLYTTDPDDPWSIVDEDKMQDIGTTDWMEITPCEPDYFFDNRDFSRRLEYDRGMSTSAIFKERLTGIMTKRDGLAIQKTQDDVLKVVKRFAALSVDNARTEFKLGKDSANWHVKDAQDDINAHSPPEKYVKQILYRPFDMRYTHYTGKSKGFISMPCYRVMQHMLKIGGNIGLFTCRNGSLDGSYNTWGSVFCTDRIGDSHMFYRSCSILHPLYIHSKHSGKKPNMADEILSALEKSYGTMPTPEDVFYYIYGILHSNTYRTKYAEFLKIDFPKIPFTKNHNLFLKIGVIGKQLADLHLMKPDVFNTSAIKYHGRGDHRVEKVGYDEVKHRVVINKKQYFEPVSKEVWEYQIGGYKVMQKWLKDRRHDVLTMDDVNHYRYIGEALGKTIELQNEIDELYGMVEAGEIINIPRKNEQSELLQ